MTRRGSRACRSALVVAGLVPLVLGVSPSRLPASAADGLRLVAVSTRADMVTGGDVLLRVEAAHGDAQIEVGGRDVTGAFRPAGDGSLVGLVEGLPAGVSTATATAGGEEASLPLTNYPITGPVFSGPHQEPFICETEQSGLGRPLDEDCSAPARIDYFYKSRVTGDFQRLDDPRAPYPPDAEVTTTTDGRTVPFVVRIESGTINRGIYRIAVLDDPRGRDPGAPYSPGEGWNRKLVYTFGGGCGTGYHQGRNAPADVLLEGFLRRGYGVASSTLNVLQTACNDVLSAETLMMVKEHFIERYGVPRFTIGNGGSGASIQQHLIASAYPGLLDALMPSVTFPDVFTTEAGVVDCRLFNRVFDADPLTWNEAKRAAVTGYATANVCRSWDLLFVDVIVATRGCDPVVPKELIYDPVTNPRGARCTIQDSMRNVMGTDPTTGFALRPYDNVGVQYGLKGLNAGAISKHEFIALNAGIGGFDIDGNLQPRRSAGDLEAVRVAYETGRVSGGRGGALAQVPIIDYFYYWIEYTPLLEIHDHVRAYSVRARLASSTGNTGNHVIWNYGTTENDNDFAGDNGGDFDLLQVMDAWLTSIEADDSTDPMAVKVRRARPAAAADRCTVAPGIEFREPATYHGSTTCNTLYPPHATPRIAAGAPLADDVLKCQLKPIDWGDYRVSFSSEEKAQLERIFPSGVCDWSRPGVGQVPMTGTWHSFGSE